MATFRTTCESILRAPSRDVALIKKTRKRIDKQLENLAFLNAHRNALAPISRLPPELLSQIFVYVAGIGGRPGGHWLSHNGQPRFFRASISWIKLVGICRHWRTVALQCPMLWTDLSLSDYHLTRKMLRRSQNLPVTVVGDLSDRSRMRTTQSVYLALEHQSRIQTLQIRGPSNRLRKIFSKMSSSSPLLEHLGVSTSHRNEDELTLPAHLFRGNIPQLRRIQLNRCSLDWDSPSFSRLTHLEVRGSSVSHLADMDVVLNVLRTIPALVTLCLVKCVMPSTTMASISEPLIMNHLSHLRLDDTSFRLLWQIKFCALASLGLHTPIINLSAELSSLITIVTSHFAGMTADNQLRSLLVEAGAFAIHMRGWTKVYPFKMHEINIEPIQLDVVLSWDDGSQERGFDIMTTLLKRLPIVKLRQLELHLGSLGGVSGRWTIEMWMELFRGSSIEGVRLHQPGEAIFTFITALIPGFGQLLANAQSTDPQPPGSNPEVFLPGLGQIWVISTDFQQSLTGGSFLDLLLLALQQMKTMCLGEAIDLLELMITNCSNITEADVARLKHFIAVDWDGEDTAREDEEEPVAMDFVEEFEYSEEEGEDF